MTLARRAATQFFVDYEGKSYDVSGVVHVFLALRQIEIRDLDSQTDQILYRHAFLTYYADHNIDQYYDQLRMDFENEILAYLVNEGVENDPG